MTEQFDSRIPLLFLLFLLTALIYSFLLPHTSRIVQESVNKWPRTMCWWWMKWMEWQAMRTGEGYRSWYNWSRGQECLLSVCVMTATTPKSEASPIIVLTYASLSQEQNRLKLVFLLLGYFFLHVVLNLDTFAVH